MTQKRDEMEIVREYSNRPPVDLPGLIGALGVKYLERPMQDDISGQIRKIDTGDYEITVNSRHAPVRKRFTAAHELGHYLFHRHLLDGEHVDILYRQNGNPYAGKGSRINQSHEVQANRFAANVLMPMHLLDAIRATGVEGTEELANLFNVSRQAMEIRLGRNRNYRNFELEEEDEDEEDRALQF